METKVGSQVGIGPVEFIKLARSLIDPRLLI